jgi:citrate lyase subunit beta/citryl-CoA lyase
MSDRPAVSWLFVPGSRPDRFDRAVAAGADATILDLEDAVAVEDKDAARDQARRWLGGGGGAWVRVNGVGTPWHDDDLTALAGSPGLRGVILPKVQEPAQPLRVVDRLGHGTKLLALVETARGVRDVAAIAACPAVNRIAFGSIDFANDIEAAHSADAMIYARGALVVASRAAGLPSPVDGVTVEVSDAAGAVTRDATRARALGFGGKLCIHPAQVEAVNRAFDASREELAWARRVLEVAREHTAAFRLDGQMIDRPVLERARRLLLAAGAEKTVIDRPSLTDNRDS